MPQDPGPAVDDEAGSVEPVQGLEDNLRSDSGRISYRDPVMYGSGLEWKREDTEMEDDRNGTTLHQMETASLICGVLSIIFYFLSLGFVSMILGIVAIVLGNRCRTQGGSVAGFVCGIVGTCP